MMLPERVIKALRDRLRRRVERLLRALDQGDKMPCASLAEQAWLVASAGRALDPEGYATIEIVQQDRETRCEFRVCVWDGECQADATTDDGLCAEHAAAQQRFDSELVELEMAVAAGGEPS